MTPFLLLASYIMFSIAGVWDKILEPVAFVRKTCEMLQLFPAYLKGEDLFGLSVPAVARIAESVSYFSRVAVGIFLLRLGSGSE